MRDRRVLSIVAAAAALIALFALVRPSDDDGGATGAPGTTDATTGATSPELQPPSGGEEASVRADIRLRGGRPLGGLQRIEASLGQTVVLFVGSSDVRDEVHVHGYDLRADVGPGNVARIVFEATMAGRFAIELESEHQQIGQLTVTP